MRLSRIPFLVLPFLLVGCSTPESSSLPSSSSSSLPSSTSSSSSSSSSSEKEPILITEDDPGTATIDIYRSESSLEDECYIAPRNVDVSLTYETLSGTLSNNQTVCPSVGEVNLLVIPVHIPGSEEYRTEQVRSDIEKAFFSLEDDDMGFLSVKEYFRNASYGKLDFSGQVTDWFDVSEYTSITSAEDIDSNSDIYTILRAAVRWARSEQNIDLSDYDYDGDGYIDGVWLVYDHLDFQTESRLDPSSTHNQIYWNLTGWDWDSIKTESEIEEQIQWGYGTSAVSWASFDTMYTSYCETTANGAPILDDLENIPLDTHTFIHETGHLLGLDDLYSTDSQTYSPAGGYTMMDQNVGDIDPASKLMLGWTTPYVVYGPSSILLREKNVNDHQVIVIPANYNEVNEEVKRQRESGVPAEDVSIRFNPFSEYLLIDLYAPTGNDEQDSSGEAINERENGPTKTGVRIYHIDTRIFKFSVIDLPNRQEYVFNPEDYLFDGETLEDNQAIIMPLSNNVSYSNLDINSYLGNQLGIDFDAFDEVRLIEAGGSNTFSYGGYMDDDTLFDTEGLDFNMTNFGIQFFQGYKLNNGNDFPFTISIETLKEVA